MKTIKLNFRHSLKSMNYQLGQHNEKVLCYGEAGKIIYEIRGCNGIDGRMTKVCGFFDNAKGCAEYINNKNGLY